MLLYLLICQIQRETERKTNSEKLRKSEIKRVRDREREEGMEKSIYIYIWWLCSIWESVNRGRFIAYSRLYQGSYILRVCHYLQVISVFLYTQGLSLIQVISGFLYTQGLSLFQVISGFWYSQGLSLF